MKKFAGIVLILSLFFSMFSSVPLFAAEVVIVDVTDPGYVESKADWLDSGLKGYEGGKTRYFPGKEAYATWTADLPEGLYKVSIFKVVAPTSNKDAKIEVFSAGAVKSIIVDYTQGSSDWEELGEYVASKEKSILVKNNKGDVGVIRTSAVKFEFVRKVSQQELENASKETVTTPKQTEVVISPSPVIAKPVEGMPIFVGVTDPGYTESEGNWLDSGLKGHDGSKTRYLSGTGDAYATWTTPLQEGLYKVSIFKIVDPSTNKDAKIEVSSVAKPKTTIIDYTVGTSEWVELGEFIASNEKPIIVKNNKSATGVIRTNAVKFEFIRSVTAEEIENANPAPTPIPPFVPEPDDGTTKVYLNRQKLSFDQPPVIQNGRTLVPLRVIFEALGAVVTWDESTKQITGVKGANVIKLQIDSNTAYKNNEGITLDQPPILLSARTLVPVRFISESFNCQVEWDEKTNSVILTTEEEVFVPKNAVLISADTFQERGTWIFDNNAAGAFDMLCLRGLAPVNDSDPKPEQAKSARGVFAVNQTGKYNVWVRSRDYSTMPGSRFFSVSINGTKLAETFGNHLANGWAWQLGGCVELKSGENAIELIDSSGFYPRMNMIYITDELDFIPPNTQEEFSKAAAFKKDFENEVKFPLWAFSEKEAKSEVSIENENVKVTFLTVPSNMNDIIQREIYIKEGSNWIKAGGREEGLGYLAIRADDAKIESYQTNFPMYETKYMFGGIEKKKMTADLYEAGEPSWMIPTLAEKISDEKAKIYAKSPTGDLEVLWELEDGAMEPMVTVKFTAKKEGYYSIGMFNKNSETKASDTDFLLLPLSINQMRFPGVPYLHLEQFTPNASSLETRTVNGRKVSAGITVDPSSIPYRWVYNDNARFGLGIRGQDGGVQTSVFAPVMGLEGSKLQPSETFEFSYRHISYLGDWYEAYGHIVTDIQGVTDYRKNYQSSLTQAGLNIQKLLMNDQFGGWDKEMKSYYNMEGRNVVSNADPLTLFQLYLMTEDEKVLEQRVIPNMAYMLTAGSFHFAGAGLHDRGPGSALHFEKAHATGQPVLNYNTDVFGGAYLMTRGLVPYFKHIGIDQIRARDNIFIPKFSEYIWMYNYTKDKSWLEKALPEADKFLETEIYKPTTQEAAYNTFFNFQYVPYFVALIDIYEATGDQKYLDGAAYGAKQLMAGMWTQPVIPAEDMEIKINEDQVIFEDLWWVGDVQQRVGFNPSDNKTIINMPETERVPAWVTARVGLGVETPATFRGSNTSKNSKNITAVQWAPELLRLAEYTGDDLFEVFARNAIIGRFSNYPGYYLNQFTTHQMKENYPYEGPDTTNIYYHHIPTYHAMVQDYLITQAWSWSNQKIDFPAARTQGYVWFFNKHYGFESGKIFDQDGMWLWMDEGIIEPDSIQVDYITAKKDGVFAAVLMNEDHVETKTTISFGEKLPSYTGEATLYNNKGEKSTIRVENGKFNVTLSPKELTAVVIPLAGINAPAYSKISVTENWNKPLGKTTVSDSIAKGYVLQMEKDSYFAFVSIPQPTDLGNKAKLYYRIGAGEWQTLEDSVYPLDFIVKVDDANKQFEFYAELTENNIVKKSATMILEPIK